MRPSSTKGCHLNLQQLDIETVDTFRSVQTSAVAASKEEATLQAGCLVAFKTDARQDLALLQRPNGKQNWFATDVRQGLHVARVIGSASYHVCDSRQHCMRLRLRLRLKLLYMMLHFTTKHVANMHYRFQGTLLQPHPKANHVYAAWKGL